MSLRSLSDLPLSNIEIRIERLPTPSSRRGRELPLPNRTLRVLREGTVSTCYSGTTPLQWMLRARVRRAQHLLETTAHSVESVAAKVGFSSATAFREHFQRVVATNPQAYRRAFRVSSNER